MAERGQLRISLSLKYDGSLTDIDDMIKRTDPSPLDANDERTCTRIVFATTDAL